jgi:ER-bound oxygenase mpaB/B'/Rubber oxygenase, catalytic domain
VYFHRYDNLQHILQLDPVQDHCQIYNLINGYEFPWDMTRSLEVALMKTYCVPSISKLLDKTGEFNKRPQKRYDDTSIIVVEMVKCGYDSERGRQALERMNAIHGRFKIANEDFLYVLSTFIYEPIRWNACFGWRRMCEQEILASFYFWREVGKRMHIQNIPETYAEFERYNIEYEQANFIYSESNARVGEATSGLFLSWFPWWMRFFVKPGLYALFDKTMLDAFGFEPAPKFLQDAVANSLKIRGKILRFCPPLTRPHFIIDYPIRSYPNGYEITQLGAKDKAE